jgi:hypothetical protein
VSEDLSIEPVSRELASVRQILDAVGGEVRSLADLADGLQHMMGRLLGGAVAPSDGMVIEEAQELDALVQRLRELASFIEELLPGVSPQWRLDAGPAVLAVRLAELARRLTRPAGDAVPPPVVMPGEPELF